MWWLFMTFDKRNECLIFTIETFLYESWDFWSVPSSQLLISLVALNIQDTRIAALRKAPLLMGDILYDR